MAMHNRLECVGMAIVWIIALVWCVWPLAFAIVFFWLFIQPFESILPPLESCNRFLERFCVWPREMGYAIFEGRSTCPSP